MDYLKQTSRGRSHRHKFFASLMVLALVLSFMAPVPAMAAESSAADADAVVAAAIEAAKNEFDTAVAEAEDGVAEAQAALSDAQNLQANAAAEVSNAESLLEQARQEKTAADEALTQLMTQESVVTEDEVLAAESERAAAESSCEQAQQAYDAAQAEQAATAEAAQAAGERVAEASAALEQARAEEADAEAAAQAADVRVAELTVQREAAEQDLENDPDYQQAVSELQQAETEAEAAARALEECDAAITDAQTLLAEAQSAELAAQEALTEKQAAAENAQADLNAAYAAKEAAEATVLEAEGAAAESEAAYQEAQDVTAEKLAEQEEAEQAVTDAKAALTEAEEAVSQAELALIDAQNELAGIQGVYDQGSLGFINWMLAKEDLTPEQRFDLEFARDVLEKAAAESFDKWYGGDETDMPEERGNMVVVFGDENDATSLENTEKTFDVMRRINELRAQDENYTGDLQRNDAVTNFYFMAVAQSGADRGAGLMRHSLLQVSTENLSFGYEDDPTLGWYDQEKAAFNQIKDDLGITSILGEDEITAIREEAGNRGISVGHYINLMWSQDQIMGVGYTPYGKYYGDTFCYNASQSSNYTDRYATYTIDEFEALFNEYCNSASVAALAQAVTDAENALNDTQATKEEKLAAVQSAQDAVEAILLELEDARYAEDAAQTDAEAQRAAAASAMDKVTEAENAVETMLAVLEEAEAEVRAAEDHVSAAQNDTSAAQMGLDNADAAREDAVQNLSEAEATVAEKKGLADNFNETLAQIGQALEDAVRQAKALWQQVTGKTAAVAEAEEEMNSAEGAFDAANAAAAAADTALLDRETVLLEARSAAADAGSRSAALRQDFDRMNTVSGQAETAAQNLAAAEAALAEAQAALDNACRNAEDMAAAQTAALDKLGRAQNLSYDEALATPITDDEFAYLNEYVQAVLDAQIRAEEARRTLEEAEENGAQEEMVTPAYRMLEGDGSTWLLGSDGVLTFRASGDYDKFVSVTVDGAVLSTADYTSASGSTIVNVNAAYLNTLSVGDHALTIVFDDGESKAVIHVGSRLTQAGSSVESEPKNESGALAANGVPKTGDDSPVALYVILCVGSMLGLVLLTKIRKQSHR